MDKAEIVFEKLAGNMFKGIDEAFMALKPEMTKATEILQKKTLTDTPRELQYLHGLLINPWQRNSKYNEAEMLKGLEIIKNLK